MSKEDDTVKKRPVEDFPPSNRTSDFLRNRRERVEKSIEQISEATGIDQEILKEYENGGAYNMNLLELYAITACLGISPDVIVELAHQDHLSELNSEIEKIVKELSKLGTAIRRHPLPNPETPKTLTGCLNELRIIRSIFLQNTRDGCDIMDYQWPISP
ncbi:hypothetical protein A2125_00375 [Candidatus Woesebacteria bacterium GWB1_43_5]|uniref:HTH cro/C1-type domain-containing protein n=1 Tax=Candidatus Woesebacteria bacterium GWB1_43_5 TaxID=1802474 RepID=A0A1F7WT19_9BACT|nr:MAG: hypothetical protein A2125_00375 [Candidatus Woesebacteria bacterium GWB1_43_5]